MKSLYNIIFFVIIVLSSAISCQKQIEYDKLSTEELFCQFITTTDNNQTSKLIPILYDSICRNFNVGFMTFDFLDAVNQDFSLRFYYNWSPFEDGKIQERNVFIAEIYRPDSLQIENRYADDFKDLSEQVKEFISNPDNNDNLPQKRQIEIGDYGMAQISKQSFRIFTNVFDTMNHRENLLKLKEMTNWLLRNYSESRDDLAIRLFDETFHDLDFERKMVVMKMIPTRIIFGFYLDGWKKKIKYGS